MARTPARRPPADRHPRVAARRLDQIAEEAGWDRPMLIGIAEEETGAPSPAELPPGPDGDLVAGLLGFLAPHDWGAMAVIVTGRAREIGQPRSAGRRVRITHVVDRFGRSASVVRGPDGTVEEMAGDGEGRMIDACLRALGQPTAPPPPDSTALWAAIWVDHLLGAAARGEPIPDAAAAARRHPAIDLLAIHEPTLLGEGITRLVRVGELLGEARPWPELRHKAAAGEWSVPHVTPEQAAWMDDGMFARWVLDQWPCCEELLEELDRRLPEEAADAVRATLAEWDLPV